MALPLLLVLAVSVQSQLLITPNTQPEVCILYADDRATDVTGLGENFTDIFSTYNSVSLSFFSYSSTNYDVIGILSEKDFSTCTILAVDVIQSDMDFVSFLQSENECSKYNKNKIHYLKLPATEEWFIYAKKLSFCPLSDSLLGIYCDTQVNATYFPLSTGTKFDVTDIPEFTEMGYTFFSVDDFYVCKRINENKWINYHLFYREYADSGTVARAIDWGNVWTGFKTFAQMLYKVLDIFFNNKRNFGPRA
uniref:Outer capsid glycoprotein VP7 n=1 Tax=Porcine rotavirus B TaxID=449582 RepID=J9PQR7_9REOV|nr:outer capsid protein VP7 [Porcine rotavirus B]AEW29901.1 outer capsid protein VP7 [Porcine rotavirus B]